MQNRLKEIRQRKGLSVRALAQQAGISAGELSRFESGSRRLSDYHLQKLAPVLQVSPGEILGDEPAVPVAYSVAAATAELHPPYDLPQPWERVTVPRLARPHECIAARVADRSADRLYPPGTLVVVRRVEHLEKPLSRGDKVLVRRFKGERRDGGTADVLVGVLDVSVTGDLSLVLRTSQRELPHAVVVRGAAGDRFAARPAGPMVDERIDYKPQDTDPAEILGRAVLAITPED